MKTIAAVAALFLAAACQSGGGYDGPYPFGPIWTPPPQPMYQPMYQPRLQTTCYRFGNVIQCN
jgi:hypothetical protein